MIFRAFFLKISSSTANSYHELFLLFSLLSAAAGITRREHYETVVASSREIEFLGVKHDIHSLSILINCFCHLQRVDFGFSVLSKILKLGLEPRMATFTTLLNGLCKEEKWIKLRCCMMICGLCQAGRPLAAQRFFRDAKEHCESVKPNMVIYTILVDSLCKCGKLKDGKELFYGHIDEGFQPNVYTHAGLIAELCKGLESNFVLQILLEYFQVGYIIILLAISDIRATNLRMQAMALDTKSQDLRRLEESFEPASKEKSQKYEQVMESPEGYDQQLEVTKYVHEAKFGELINELSY
uniref:Pentatricopeptide repeat-containing protein n=1 Tax=Populus trichocarpa TaxID=3694 RepID=A0A2K2BL78_POPTR